MNAETLHGVFRATLAPNNETRRAAEASLAQSQRKPGFVVACLQIANAKQVDKVLRKIAGVYLKNTISPSGGGSFASSEEKTTYRWHHIPETDRVVVRQHLLECFLSQEGDKSMRNILGEAILGVAQDDFPKVWTSLVPELQKNLQSNNQVRVLNALIAVRKLVKKYQFRRKNEREPLVVLVKHLFPLVKRVFASVAASNELVAAEMMKICTKIYWSAMQLSLDGERANPNDCQMWMQLFHAVLKKPLPEASTGLEPKGQPLDFEERLQWPWWKLKKWTWQVLHRFFSRYGNKGYVEDTHRKLAVWWEKTWAKPFLCIAMETLQAHAKGTAFVSSRCLHLSFCFVNNAVELSSTYKIILPHLNFLLFQSIIPTLSFSKDDFELWRDDPHEYVRKSLDMEDDYINPRTSAMNLLMDLAKLRKEPLQLLMPYLAQHLNQYVNAGNARTDAMTRHKDGCLVALGALSEILMENEKYMNALEGLITNHVLPEFQNGAYPFMRERACWIIMRYAELEFDSEHNLQCCVQRVLKSLRDTELPVQMMAATSLRFLLDSDTAEKVIGPVLPQVLQEFFRLMNEIGLDELIHSLEKMLGRFGEQIIPIAPTLTVKLAEMFNRFHNSNSSGGSEDEEDESQMAALTTLECICTILETTYDHPTVLAQMEATIVPLCHYLLKPTGECIEFLDQTLRIMGWFTYKVPRFSPATWQLFPLLFQAFDKFAFDYVEHMLPSLDNYVSRWPDAFLNAKVNGSTPYVQLLWNIVQKTVEKNESQIERATSTKILESLLLNCRGKVDTMIEPIIKLLLNTVQGITMPSVQCHVVRVIAAAIYYNPVLSLRVLDSLNATTGFFQLWIKLLQDEKCFKTVIDKKICTIALTCILSIPAQGMSASVRGGYAQILAANVQCLENLHKQKQRIAASAAKADDDEEGDEEEEDDDDAVEVEDRVFDENEDAISAEDSAYLKMIKKMQNEEKDYLGVYDEDEEEEDEDEDSPVHGVNAFVYFHDSLNAQNNALVTSSRNSLPAPSQATLGQILAYAATQKQAFVQAAAMGAARR